MNARYTQGYFLSCLLHASVVMAVLFLAYLSDQAGLEKPKVFELVAGEGDNYAATEAPAIGVPGGVKAVVPPAPVEPSPPVVETPPVPDTVPIEPVPAPVPVPAPTPRPRPTPHPTKIRPVPSKDAVPNFTRQVQRIAHHRAARLEAKYRKELEAEHRRQMSYEEHLKEYGGAAPEGIHGGVVGGSTANKAGGAGGKAMTREEGSLLEAYFALLKARTHENFEAPTDVSEKLVARVTFFVSADGSISHVRIVRSSGNAAFDQAVLDAFHRTRSIGPRPDHHGDEVGLSFSLREEDGE